MRHTIICVIAALLAGCASQPRDSELQGARHSNQHTTVGETFRRDSHRTNAPPDKIDRFPADVSINKDAGRGDFLWVTLGLETGESLPFSVDTGSPITVVDKSFEPLLGKRLGTMPIRKVGRAWQESGCYAAPKIWLGDVPLQTGSNVWTYDFKQSRGILGMDCLKNYCIQLDFQAGKMRFLVSEHLNTAELGKAFPLTLSGTGPQGKFVRPTIQHVGLVGDDTNLLVDTGCRIDGLTERGAMWNVIWGRLLAPFGKGHSHSCVWDGENYTNIKIAPVGDANVLGLRFLARHLVTLDFPGRTLYLKQSSVGPLNSVSEAHTAPSYGE